MGDKVEKTCPLCTELMDFTDQQLKPCKCGYELCVWCLHHIMEMSKDDSKGRCPACRSPYDMEKIVGTTISNKRLAELNSGRRQKLQKVKLKTSEVEKDISNLRVVQRNVVYVASLPANVANEETLRKKEFLGQYGKILRIVICRATAAIQNLSSTKLYNVYATFSKVEEALRCIQVVNGYILDGRALKACFGAARYCEAWLKNKPCGNRNCIYLHAAGAQEDTCMKDEVLTLCTSKVQELGITLYNYPRRSGSCFPPPADNYKHSTDTACKVPQTPPAHVFVHNCKTLHQNIDSGKSGVLPAAASWGQEFTSARPSYASVAVSQGVRSHLSRPSNSLSSKNGEVQISKQSQDTDQSNKQLVSLTNRRVLSDKNLQTIQPQRAYAHNFYVDCKAHIEADRGIKDSVDVTSLLLENNDRIQTLSQAQSSSCIMKSRQQQYLPNDSVHYSATANLDYDYVDGNMTDFASVFQHPVVSSKRGASASEFGAIAVGRMFETAAIYQNVSLPTDRMGISSSLDLCISAANSEAGNCSFLSGKGKVENNHTISALTRYLKSEQENFQVHNDSISCVREELNLHQVDLQFQLPTCAQPMTRDFGMCQKANMKTNVVDDMLLEDSTDSGEFDVISDILALNLGLDEYIPDDDNLTTLLGNTNIGSKSSQTFNSWMYCDQGGPKFPLTIDSIDNLTSDFSVKENADRFCIVEENTTCRWPFNAFTCDGPNDSHNVQSSYCLSTSDIVDSSQFLLDLHQSVPLSSTLRESQLYGHPAKKSSVCTPPGFPPRSPVDQDQAYSVFPPCGSTDQCQFREGSPRASISENIWRSDSADDFTSIDPSTREFTSENLLQSTVDLVSSHNDYDLRNLSEMNQRLAFQTKLGNSDQHKTASIDQSTMKDVTLHDAVLNCYGTWSSCSISSLAAADSMVVGRSGHSSWTESSNCRRISPSSHYEFQRQFHEHDDFKFQLPDASCFYNVPCEQI